METGSCAQEGKIASTHSYVQETQFSGQMQRRVAIVGEVGVLQACGIVFDYASEEGEVFEVDSPADADGDVDPMYFLQN